MSSRRTFGPNQDDNEDHSPPEQSDILPPKSPGKEQDGTTEDEIDGPSPYSDQDVLELCDGHSNAAKIDYQFRQAEIVPYVINESPKRIVGVKYPGGAVVKAIGRQYRPQQVSDEPKIVAYEFRERGHKRLYTIMMIDPDAPKPSYLHWLVVNVPGNKFHQGETIAKYSKPRPPGGSGFHRYIFLVYVQKTRINSNDQQLRKFRTKRQNFDANAFVNRFQLGSLVTGNFMLIRH